MIGLRISLPGNNGIGTAVNDDLTPYMTSIYMLLPPYDDYPLILIISCTLYFLLIIAHT
jgi:hypothetical protein